MKILKVDMRLMVCFEIRELVDLLLWPVESLLLNTTLNARTEGIEISEEVLKQSAIKFGKNSADSKDYEYWAAIFSLYEEVGDCVGICFYLKNTFNPQLNTINSYAELEKFKEDPPDVIIEHKSGSFSEFELKRYRGELTENNIFKFIDEKILKHYSTAFNFFIILQNKPETIIPELIFENLFNRIKEKSIKRDMGRICIMFNANNQNMIFTHIYPEFSMYKTPFVSGSRQYKNIIKLNELGSSF